MDWILPLSCTPGVACADTTASDWGIPLAVAGAAVVLIVGVVLFRRRHVQWTFLLGVIATITGTALVFGPGAPATFGWYAYAPLSEATFGVYPLAPRRIAGLIIGAVGLLVTGFGLGGMFRRSQQD